MQIKRQVYVGKPVIALYIRDKTEHVHEKLLMMQFKEESQMKQQAESFTSTISHEMRTPILTIIFFLQQIMDMLNTIPFNENKIALCTT